LQPIEQIFSKKDFPDLINHCREVVMLLRHSWLLFFS